MVGKRKHISKCFLTVIKNKYKIYLKMIFRGLWLGVYKYDSMIWSRILEVLFNKMSLDIDISHIIFI